MLVRHEEEQGELGGPMDSCGWYTLTVHQPGIPGTDEDKESQSTGIEGDGGSWGTWLSGGTGSATVV